MTIPPPTITWSFELPSRLKIAIADAVTLFAKIESCMLETVCVLEGADLSRKKKLSRDAAANHMEALEATVS